MKRILYIIVLTLMASVAQAQLLLTPSPQEFETQDKNGETFVVDSLTAVFCYDKRLNKFADLVRAEVLALTSHDVSQLTKKTAQKAIILLFDPEIPLNDHGYWINTTPGRVILSAPTEEGLFYAICSWFQLNESERKDGTIHTPLININDEPENLKRVYNLQTTPDNALMDVASLAFLKFNAININVPITEELGNLAKSLNIELIYNKELAADALSPVESAERQWCLPYLMDESTFETKTQRLDSPYYKTIISTIIKNVQTWQSKK